MKRLLLVDDQQKDIRTAAEVARELGIEDIEAKNSIFAAHSYLEKGLKGTIPLPDGIILDLDLGIESGFEPMRFWHSTSALSSIPLIVWTVVDEQQELCSLFKVSAFVSKWHGPTALREALAKLVC